MNLKPEKLLSLDAALKWRIQQKEAGRTVVLTNGCFDLLHPGHVAFLRHSAGLGDSLLVALNGDQSVRALKGLSRPILNQNERAWLLDALTCVSAIIVFDTQRLDREIAILQPDIYTKAGDYTLASLDAGERAALQHADTEIRFLPFVEGFSTTSLIDRIRNA